jgi:predicted small metal-binding protein
MNRKLIALLSVITLALSTAALARAEDAGKAAEAAKPVLYTAKCPSPCDFSVKSHDKAEIVTLLRDHAKSHHNGMALSEADAEAMVKVAGPKK